MRAKSRLSRPSTHKRADVSTEAVDRFFGEIPGGSLSALVAGVDRLLHVGHRFGMSDNDPQNVYLIIRAMCDCKKKYPDKRFFVINTHEGEKVKLEVFPVTLPVAGRPGEIPGGPYD